MSLAAKPPRGYASAMNEPRSNIEAVARMVNAQNQRLERELKRQKIWNYALTAGLVIAITVALIRA